MTDSQVSHDLLVIGGGVNGAGIAADAAGRGLDVVLCEKSDLASATSSSSSKLIHGGLRYLEFYEFSLVRKALRERDVLAMAAPHIIRPMAFQIPQLPHSRNALLIRAGLFLYDNLARRQRFKHSSSIRFDRDGPLNAAISKGFEYWDAQVDDSRLVVLNALQARQHGASILTRTECTAISPEEGGWQVTLHDHLKGLDSIRSFRAIVNASGPWVASLLEGLTHKPAPHRIRLVKGSHIVVPKIHDGEHAYLLQHHDGRVVFVIPYREQYSLIGTTEKEFQGELDRVEISTDEISYLISIVNLYFKKSILHSDIVNTYSGVRPLIDQQGKSASKISREYRLELSLDPSPLLSVYGGKVTTYRVLSEHVMNKLGRCFPGMGSAWTGQARLPGGDFDLPENLFNRLATRYRWLGPDMINRWLASYGTLSFDILGDARGLDDLGMKFGNNLYQREVDYLCREEWARTAEDILWRRSKLGYQFDEKQTTSLSNYLKQSYPIN